ncbi:type I methionyl aminopeptidase [Streptobacillus moniliformis]|uniref:Methionine aminopeptidase n=1 Tax=Streptobacillus moniliformis (strain ATCC 14647 / DSM 12112 / NCTC 10651 / 9901) TaxID=519441 RepID=D1AVM2_STRM9|nr:type I methionyl aminopeptidase [Streptobacillus moniliformis]ACZ01782.1 methionine aminopeptidase, type I [Streptobacillus moniliformis DSM 12112]AVL43221.1 type I methionyl aminopeptidase [Streptobacillus moniliformis]SQA13024.1 Methionine aminopeptidase 1 [Streptobacillus moniliformis]
MVKLKTLEDIKKIKKANEIIARLYEDIIPKYIKPGISTWEIDAICEDYIMSQGAIPGTKGYDIGWPYPTYPASTCISINEKVVHGIPSKTEILKEGDILSLDTVTILDGYFGDAAKTFAVGNIDDKSRKLIEVTEKAREIGIEQARAGNRIGDIGFAIQQYVEKFGFSVVRDFSGHGVGFAMHEDPYVLNYGKANTGLKIENGLVIAIEPMVNIGTFKVKILKDMWTVVTQDKKRSAHFEHSVAIVDGKPLILSQK